MSTFYNGAGYPDPTAHDGLKPIIHEELQMNQLIKTLKFIISLTDFELIERIQLRSKTTGREYK